MTRGFFLGHALPWSSLEVVRSARVVLRTKSSWLQVWKPQGIPGQKTHRNSSAPAWMESKEISWLNKKWGKTQTQESHNSFAINERNFNKGYCTHFRLYILNSQNKRLVEVKRDIWSSYGPSPYSSRATQSQHCPGLFPDSFPVSLRVQSAQLLCATCASSQSPSQQKLISLCITSSCRWFGTGHVFNSSGVIYYLQSTLHALSFQNWVFTPVNLNSKSYTKH